MNRRATRATTETGVARPTNLVINEQQNVNLGTTDDELIKSLRDGGLSENEIKDMTPKEQKQIALILKGSKATHTSPGKVPLTHEKRPRQLQNTVSCEKIPEKRSEQMVNAGFVLKEIPVRITPVIKNKLDVIEIASEGNDTDEAADSAGKAPSKLPTKIYSRSRRKATKDVTEFDAVLTSTRVKPEKPKDKLGQQIRRAKKQSERRAYKRLVDFTDSDEEIEIKTKGATVNDPSNVTPVQVNSFDDQASNNGGTDDETHPPLSPVYTFKFPVDVPDADENSNEKETDMREQDLPSISNSLKRKLPDSKEREEPPSKMTACEDNNGDPFKHFLWDENHLQETPYSPAKRLTNTKRKQGQSDSWFFAKDGEDVEKVARKICFYFDQHRVLLREAQNNLPGRIPNGDPVMVGRHVPGSLDAADDTAMDFDSQHFITDSPVRVNPRFNLRPTRQTKMNSGTLNFVSRGQKLVTSALRATGKTISGITSNTLSGVANAFSAPTESRSGESIFCDATQINDSETPGSGLVPDTQYDSGDDFVSLPKIPAASVQEVVPETQLEDTQLYGQHTNKLNGSRFHRNTQRANDESVVPNKDTEIDKENASHGRSCRKGRGRGKDKASATITRPSTSTAMDDDPGSRKQIFSYAEDIIDTTVIKRKIGRREKKTVDPVIGDGEALPTMHFGKHLGRMNLDSVSSDTDIIPGTPEIQTESISLTLDGSFKDTPEAPKQHMDLNREECADPNNGECPICHKCFTAEKITQHAAYCNGSNKRRPREPLSERRATRREARLAMQRNTQLLDNQANEGAEVGHVSFTLSHVDDLEYSSDEFKPRKEELKQTKADEREYDADKDPTAQPSKKRRRARQNVVHGNGGHPHPRQTRKAKYACTDCRTSFATLDARANHACNQSIPSSSNACPLCGQHIPLSEFQAHVPQCCAEDDRRQSNPGLLQPGIPVVTLDDEHTGGHPADRLSYADDESRTSIDVCGASSVSTNTLWSSFKAKIDQSDSDIVSLCATDEDTTDYSSDNVSSDSSDPQESVSLRQTLLSAQHSRNTISVKSGETSPIRSFRPISGADDDLYQAQFKRPVGKTLEEIRQNREKRKRNSQKGKRRKLRKKAKTIKKC